MVVDADESLSRYAFRNTYFPINTMMPTPPAYESIGDFES